MTIGWNLVEIEDEIGSSPCHYSTLSPGGGFFVLSWSPAHFACRLGWSVWFRGAVNGHFFFFLVTISSYLFSPEFGSISFICWSRALIFCCRKWDNNSFWNNFFNALSQNIGGTAKRNLQEKVVKPHASLSRSHCSDRLHSLYFTNTLVEFGDALSNLYCRQNM